MKEGEGYELALEVFSYGQFAGLPRVVAWDGTNHEEILDWVHSEDADTTEPEQRAVIATVTDDALTISKPGYPDAVVQRGWWVGVNGTFVMAVNPAGKWRSDQHGRPTTLDDLLAEPSAG